MRVLTIRVQVDGLDFGDRLLELLSIKVLIDIVGQLIPSFVELILVLLRVHLIHDLVGETTL